MSKAAERTMLTEACARVRRHSVTLEDLLWRDACARDLIQAMADLAYAVGTVQGACAVYIPAHAQTDEGAPIPAPN
jgi:hypothetical protein